MRNFLLSAFLVLSISTPVWAQPDDGLRGSSGETCDWSEYKDSLFGTESAGSGGYQAFNGCANAGCTETANGKYQFLEGTAAGLTTFQQARQGQPPGLDPGCTNIGAGRNVGFNRDICGPLQEAMMDEFSMRNLQELQNNCPAASASIGKQVTGSCSGKSVTCTVTWSGILAGAHIGGVNGICSTLGGGPDRTDNLGTSRLCYVCKHGGLQVPSADCSPAPYTTTTGGTVTPPITDGWDGTTPPPGRAGWEDPLKKYWVGGLQLMATQLSAVMMQQVHAIGKFFDAKHQLELQRLLQQKYARAHKDYHPSEQMCEIGTFSRDLLNAEQRAKLTKATITEDLMDRSLNSGDTLTKQGNISDRKSRLKQYIETFCNTEDNAHNNTLLCETSGDVDQQNIDIDYTRLIDVPLTLDVDLTTTGSSTPADIKEKKTETNLFAFLNYIFMHDTLPTVGRAKTTLEKFVVPYQDARSLVAMRSVAYNSFAHIIAMKTAGPKMSAGSSQPASPYLKALMREMGMGDEEITDFLGDNPSYYAQMEVLTKKIYQDPSFVANLYDKPANVRRIRAAMTAIKLMQDRDIHEALMRREMLISMIVELQLRQKQDKITDKINNMIALPEKDGKPLIPTSAP